MIVLPLIAVSGYAAVQLYALAARRGRRGVRSTALHARAALIVGLLLTAFGSAVNPWAAPLLLLPAAAAVRLTLPRLSTLIQHLYAEPWGPSDPAVRRAAADPALVVPAQALLLGAIFAGFTSSWTAAVVSYGLALVSWGGLVLLARHRRTRLARYRVGTLRRVLRQPRAYAAPDAVTGAVTGAVTDAKDDIKERHPVAA